MGRKGTNKGKPVSKKKQTGSVTELVKDKGAPLSKGSVNSSTGSNKTHNKH